MRPQYSFKRVDALLLCYLPKSEIHKVLKLQGLSFVKRDYRVTYFNLIPGLLINKNTYLHKPFRSK
jgi:hypothetical protein